MEKKEIFKRLPDAIIPWYHTHKRDLPWRKDKDPYHVWLSEIMLQQTRVEAVKSYYARFLNALPTINDLANADEQLLHKLWEGLGYYSRVRNLKKAAQVTVKEHNGIFPREYSKVIALPGIGEYTAGAICSIVYDLPVPAVDGNVLRVVARLTDDHNCVDLPTFKKTVRNDLEAVYPAEAGAFTQALMELGATVCGPNRKPDCVNCPCTEFCLANQRRTAEQLPVRKEKQARRIEDKTVFVLSCGGQYALEQREDKGLLAGLWQFPNLPGKIEVPAALCAVEEMGLRPREILKTVERRHIFTHIEWHMNGIYMEVSDAAGSFTWLGKEQIQSETALPTAFRQFLEEI